MMSVNRYFIGFVVIFICSLSIISNGSSKLRIAGLQMNVTKSIEQNKVTIIDGILKAAEGGAKYLVTPEGSLSGYHSKFSQSELEIALAEVRKIAKEKRIGLFLGTCYFQEVNGKEYCYNQVRVYTPTGELLGVHSKILLCSPTNFPGTGEITEYVQGNLNTFLIDGIKFGVLICNDLWATPGYTTIPNPYLPWKLKQLGAQIIIHTINSGSNPRYRKFHESSAELWAMTLEIPIVEVNAAKGDIKLNASSGLINSKGEREVIAPDIGEQLFYCDIDIGSLKNTLIQN